MSVRLFGSRRRVVAQSRSPSYPHRAVTCAAHRNPCRRHFARIAQARRAQRKKCISWNHHQPATARRDGDRTCRLRSRPRSSPDAGSCRFIAVAGGRKRLAGGENVFLSGVAGSVTSMRGLLPIFRWRTLTSSEAVSPEGSVPRDCPQSPGADPGLLFAVHASHRRVTVLTARPFTGSILGLCASAIAYWLEAAAGRPPAFFAVGS